MLAPHVATGRVVEKVSPRLADNRLGTQLVREEVRVALQHGAHRPVVHGTDAARICEQNRRPELTRPSQWPHAGELAVAVQRQICSEDRLPRQHPAVRQNRGDTGAHRPLAFDEGTVAANQRRKSHSHAGNVGDGVERTRRQIADDDAEVTQPTSRRRGCTHGARDCHSLRSAAGRNQGQ